MWKFYLQWADSGYIGAQRVELLTPLGDKECYLYLEAHLEVYLVTSTLGKRESKLCVITLEKPLVFLLANPRLLERRGL